jgi:L-ribulose-5-phosphate 3-epimerase
MPQQISRRSVMAGLAGLAAAPAPAAPAGRFTICAFSKHFHWTDVKECAELCARFGYEGIDLTLRKGGHVLPERVAEDLPRALETVKKAGLTMPMCTTDIVDVTSPHAEAVIKTMSSLGIKRYRWGGFLYDEKIAIPEQLAQIKPKVKELAALNRKYGVAAMYHTHSGINQVGASFWDLWWLLKDNDTEAVGVNYDIGHDVVEGGFGGWINSARLLMPYIKGVAVKDFKWEQNARGAWVPGWCALGEGMVNFRRFFTMLKEARFSGPLQLHMEYPELGGADTGKTSFTIPKDRLLAIMQRDVVTLKKLLREGGLPA